MRLQAFIGGGLLGMQMRCSRGPQLSAKIKGSSIPATTITNLRPIIHPQHVISVRPRHCQLFKLRLIL